MTIRRAIKNSLSAASPVLGSKCAALWDSLVPVLQGRFTAGGATKYIIFGFCPGVGGRFTYFGTRAYFPRGSAIFQSACEHDTYEPDVTAWLCRLVEPGTLFIDIGANIGLTSIPVLRAVQDSRVLSFEPSPNSLPYLQRTQSESAFAGRWEVLGKAAGASATTVQFCVAAPRYGAWDGLRDTERAGDLQTVDVPMTTVDAEWRRLGSPRVSCIKIDVEGAESQVLVGSEATVHHERPRILLEWNRVNLAAHHTDICALLHYAESHHYEVMALPSMNTITELHALELHMLHTEMFLLVPKLRLHRQSVEIA